MATAALTQKFFDRHRDKIKFAGPDDCWLWSACKSKTGYGQVRARGKMQKAHREAFEAEHGTGSADGFLVRHRCDVPACVNPAHLEIGTAADNMRDRDERGRHVALKGTANGSAKLTEDDVRAIRRAYVRGSRTHGTVALGRRFETSNVQIGMIVRRKLWAHI